MNWERRHGSAICMEKGGGKIGTIMEKGSGEAKNKNEKRGGLFNYKPMEKKEEKQ